MKHTLKLDQISYATKVIEHFKLNNAKVARTPVPSGYNPAPNPKTTTPQLHSHYQLVRITVIHHARNMLK